MAGLVDGRLMVGGWWLMDGCWMDGGWMLDVGGGLWVMAGGG